MLVESSWGKIGLVDSSTHELRRELGLTYVLYSYYLRRELRFPPTYSWYFLRRQELRCCMSFFGKSLPHLWWQLVLLEWSSNNLRHVLRLKATSSGYFWLLWHKLCSIGRHKF